jgi:uncharacterized protein YybS (DUF2232 family)
MTALKGSEMSFFSKTVLIIAVIFLVPVLLPGLLGWLIGLLAVPVACVLASEGGDRGKKTILNSLIIATVIAVFIGKLEILLFGITLVPLGYILYRCTVEKKSEAVTAGRGILALLVSWWIFWAIYGSVTGIQPYQHLLDTVDAGFAQTYELYKTEQNIPSDVQQEVTVVVTGLRETIPMVMPGVLTGIVVFTVWINLIIFNKFLLKRNELGQQEPVAWVPYCKWQLPDQLIWVPILAAGLFLLVDGNLRYTGLNILLISGMVYCFQGLAVFIHLLDRWKVPSYLRMFFYFLLIIQSLGLIIITLLGVADTWFKFRSPKKSPPEQAG